MNQFLASLEITFRRDPTNFRPRVNKAESMKDREQKGELVAKYLLGAADLISLAAAGNYFFLEE
jgi:ATP-binding cassette subfamily E protein 1